MEARRAVRYLAPIALVATIAGAYVIVHHNATQHPSASSTHHPGSRRPRRKFYVVRPGDNLTSIATRTHVALTTLEDLNPTLDPNSLQAGQRIRLRR
jgi:LysM repeat protein